MTLDMVLVVTYVRNNPGTSKESIVKNLKLKENTIDLLLAGLSTNNLITIDGSSKIHPKKKS